jgi:hypothetical protein
VLTERFVNRTPRSASASMFGVRHTALSKHPSASARNWSGMNSATFGRPGTAAPYDVVTDLAVGTMVDRPDRSIPGPRGKIEHTHSRPTKGDR